MSEKDWKNNFWKKLSQKFFLGPANFIFDKPAELIPTKFRKKIHFLSKKIGKEYFLKNTFFSLKCSYGQVECSFNKPAKKRQEAESICSVSENDKKFQLFSKTDFFYQKTFL